MSKINEFPLISVITVCFNAAHFIEQTIRSVLSQTYPYIEYLIIDGGSTDGTAEIIRKYESRLAYWHSKPDRGLAHAFNLGLAQAQGSWIIYLNADDFFLDSSVIEQMAPHLILNQKVDVVFGQIMILDRQKNPAPLPLGKLYYGNSWRWQEFRWYDTIPHQGAFTNRSYFNKVGNFNESLQSGVDYEFYLRVGKHLKTKFIPIRISGIRVGGLSGNDQIIRIASEYRQVQQKAGALPIALCWLNFFWKIVRHFLLKAIHKVLDPYSSRFSFKNRMSGNLIKSFNLDQAQPKQPPNLGANTARLPIKHRVKSLLKVNISKHRYAHLKKLFYQLVSLAYIGSKYECPFCRGHFRKFWPFYSEDIDPIRLAEQKKIVGLGYIPDYFCPRCLSENRERLIYLYLVHGVSLLDKKIKLLHIAPELNLQKFLKNRKNIDYLSGDLDLENSLAMVKMDITKIMYEDNLFDVIICSHVLEHVPDDIKAMAELRRVLKPGGFAMLLVPRSLLLDITYEDHSVTEKKERSQVFGQADHVRIYGKDFKERLEQAGFEVQEFDWRAWAEQGGVDFNKFGLGRDELLYIASKPSSIKLSSNRFSSTNSAKNLHQEVLP